MKSNWAKITEEMAMHYGCTTYKGVRLISLSQLCVAADRGDRGVEYTDYGKIGLIGAIPSCIENGSDFCQEAMRDRLCGFSSLYPNLCYAKITHDLNSFEIPSIGDLVTEIRMS